MQSPIHLNYKVQSQNGWQSIDYNDNDHDNNDDNHDKHDNDNNNNNDGGNDNISVKKSGHNNNYISGEIIPILFLLQKLIVAVSNLIKQWYCLIKNVSDL